MEEYFEQLKNIFINHYSEETVDYVEIEDIVNITIHFPELNITNRNELSHTIKDLYVRLTFNKVTGKLLERPQGTKLTYSLAEYSSKYIHSHLPPYSIDSFSPFCLGATAFAEFVAVLQTERPTEDQLEYFLYQLDNYLVWESLEGGPYNRISNIAVKINNGRSISTLGKDYIIMLIKELENIPINVVPGNYYYEYHVDRDNPNFLCNIGNIALDLGLGDSFLYFYDPVTSTYFEGSNDPNSINGHYRELSQLAYNYSIIFKNEIRRCNIEYTPIEEDELENTSMFKTLHKDNIVRICELLENRIYELQNLKLLINECREEEPIKFIDFSEFDRPNEDTNTETEPTTSVSDQLLAQ